MRPTIFFLFVCIIATQVPQRTLSEQDISILFPEYSFDDLDSVSDNGGCKIVEDEERWRRSRSPSPKLTTVDLDTKPEKSYVRTVPKRGKKVRMPPKKRSFVCDECAKRFKNKFHLNRHALTHSDEKPFKCLVDGCSFENNREDNLLVHRLKHLKKQEFPVPAQDDDPQEMGVKN
jgi:uncharacterized Zn-finger protein